MGRRPRWLTCALALAGAVFLAACAKQPRKEVFATYLAHMQSKGYLRTETAPADVPYSNSDLAEHFRRIAFYTYPNDREHIPKPLTRWETPIRYAVLGTADDRSAVRTLMARMSALTGLDIGAAPEDEANFLILILDEDDQRAAVRTLHDAHSRRFFDDFLSAIFDCGAIAGWTEDDPTIRKALVYLHGDLTGLYRRLCFHEEISQSLGLFNDDPAVRPSIFNDDDEFALLTAHDEYLIRILYDPRLRSGMTPEEAMPVVRTIVDDLRPAE